jgi:hypothetical protein
MIHKVWMSAAGRRKAAWGARAAASTSGCNNHFASEGQRSTMQTHQTARPQDLVRAAMCSTMQTHQAALALARADQ